MKVKVETTNSTTHCNDWSTSSLEVNYESTTLTVRPQVGGGIVERFGWKWVEEPRRNQTSHHLLSQFFLWESSAASSSEVTTTGEHIHVVSEVTVCQKKNIESFTTGRKFTALD